MHAAISSLKTRVALAVSLAALFALALVQNASAAAQDYSSVTGDVSTEVGAALPVALGAVSLIIGVTLAYRVIRKILRA